MTPDTSREETLDEVERKAGEYKIESGCCAQGCLRALCYSTTSQYEFHAGIGSVTLGPCTSKQWNFGM
jgi:hypothetical protein